MEEEFKPWFFGLLGIPGVLIVQQIMELIGFLRWGLAVNSFDKIVVYGFLISLGYLCGCLGFNYIKKWWGAFIGGLLSFPLLIMIVVILV